MASQSGQAVVCPNCAQTVPSAPFCVCCGEPLENAGSPYPHEGRGYAAAPHQRWYAPWVISSIFPHLPRTDMRTFRIALLGGIAVVAVLSLFGLFPLALIAAAAVTPLLTVLYLVNVDLYEGEPAPMLVFTIAWGALAGFGVGIAARHATSTVSLVTERTGGHNVLWLGVLLPLASVALMIAGPLVLLPYRRFNDVLDGATFGAACAVTCVGAEAVTNAAGFLGGGLHAPGDETLWIVRLLTLGVAFPLLAAGAIGAATAAFWLRYRAEVDDRRVLGVFGSPPVAAILAAAAIVAANVCELYVNQWWNFLIALALAATALVGLRRVIHLGLQEEAKEKPIAGAVTCTNCGHSTPLHTFCGNCGIALRALPKRGGVRETPGSLLGGRLSRHALLVWFCALLTVAVAAAIVIIVLERPGPISARCKLGTPCPQAAASNGNAYELGKEWPGNTGVRLRYDTNTWTPFKLSDQHIFLKADVGSTHEWAKLVVISDPASSETAEQLLAAQVAAEQSGYIGLELDKTAAHQILGPQIGFAPALTAIYTGTVDSSASPAARVHLIFEVATYGPTTTLVEAVTNEGAQVGSRSSFPDLDIVDTVLDSYLWPAAT